MNTWLVVGIIYSRLLSKRSWQIQQPSRDSVPWYDRCTGVDAQPCSPTSTAWFTSEGRGEQEKEQENKKEKKFRHCIGFSANVNAVVELVWITITKTKSPLSVQCPGKILSSLKQQNRVLVGGLSSIGTFVSNTAVAASNSKDGVLCFVLVIMGMKKSVEKKVSQLRKDVVLQRAVPSDERW